MHVNPARIAPLPTGPRETARPAAPAAAAGTPRAPATAAARGETLWDVLTPEEREFFARQAALGPVTYGPARRASEPAPAPLGGRVDVRG